MKKFIVLLCAIILCACSANIKDTAERQMKRTINELASKANKEAVEIRNVETVFSTDSTVILHCSLQEQNKQPEKIEYIYDIGPDGKKQEAILNIDQSVLKAANKAYAQIDKEMGDKNNLDFNKNIEIQVAIALTFYGREIKE